MSTVVAPLRFFVPPADKSAPWINVNANTNTGEREKNYTQEPVKVEIENIRGKEASTSLDGNGFQYFRRAAKHTSFANDEEIKQEYYPESIELIKELTGASKVVLFDHSRLILTLSLELHS